MCVTEGLEKVGPASGNPELFKCRSARKASRALKYTGAGSGVGAGSNLDGRRQIYTAFRGGLHGGGVASPDQVEKADQAQVQYDQRNA